MAERPSVLLIDQGELEDVHRLLHELQADSVRADGAARPEEWPWPTRLLIATAGRALALGAAPPGAPVGFTAIAIADGDSKSLRTLLRRVGFDYLVRRPVHPEALKLLLLQALYSGRERRRARRLPAGYRVACRVRWRRWEATLAEISPTGCRLLARRSVKIGKRLAIRVPRELGGKRSLTLRGRVVRCSRRGTPAEPGDAVLVLAFEGLARAARQSLGALLDELTAGPATLPQRVDPAGPDAAAPVGSEEGVRAAPAPPEPSAGEPPTPEVAPEATRSDVAAEEPARVEPPRHAPVEVHHEARRHPRRPFGREVVALDERAESVVHVLAGRDLSVGGLRVDPHPSLAVGDRLRLAIYDASCREPLIVDAEMVHDDGGRGLGLRFHVGDPALTARVEAVVGKLPAVEVLSSGEAEPHGVVIAEIVPRDT